MNLIFEKISNAGIVPVVKIEDAKDAVPLAKALQAGGLPVAEITFRTKAAEEAIRRISEEVPQVLVGAGTIVTLNQAKAAVAAGAKFLVTPGFNPEIVNYCVEQQIPVTPGCSNPTDIELALGFGLDTVKFFPAEAFGGLATIKALSAPYGDIKFIPTGGIDENNMTDYLAFGKILAIGGSFMVKADWIAQGRFDEITRCTRAAVAKVLGFELAHIGINTQNEEEAKKTAGIFSALFGFEIKDGSSSVFAGPGIEVNKGAGLGRLGHIAIRTNSIPRALAYFEQQGAAVDMSTAKTKNNKINAVYLKEEIAGFAVHLMQK
jgi:2-dehydro-3-deoxyphosphogluconate aldolase/(4S)-4-hydroxy-2-oxoglutarate aldolase